MYVGDFEFLAKSFEYYLHLLDACMMYVFMLHIYWKCLCIFYFLHEIISIITTTVL